MTRERRGLIGITVAAFLIRLTWVLSLDRDGFAFNDSVFYSAGANSILHGNGYLGLDGAPTARWPPGYSTVLATVYRVFGSDPLHGEILNAVLGAAAVPLLYLLVRPWFGTPVAAIAAVMLCVMPGPIIWTDLLVTETLVTLLYLGFFVLATRSRPTWGWAVGLGVYVGLATMVRGEAPVWMLVPLVLWWRAAGWKVSVGRMAAAGAALALVMTPWVIRNERVFDAFVPLALNSSETMWAGHNPAATGAQMYPSQALLDRLAGGTEGPARALAVSDGLRNESLRYMVHHPVHELTLIPRKVVALLRGDAHAFDWVNMAPYPALGENATWFFGTLADAAWFALLAFTVVGALGLGRAVWRCPLMVAIATSFLTALVLYGFVYYGNYRYRLPYEPLMMVVAALVADRGLAGLRAARVGDAPVDDSPLSVDDPHAAAAEIAEADHGANAAEH